MKNRDRVWLFSLNWWQLMRREQAIKTSHNWLSPNKKHGFIISPTREFSFFFFVLSPTSTFEILRKIQSRFFIVFAYYLHFNTIFFFTSLFADKKRITMTARQSKFIFYISIYFFFVFFDVFSIFDFRGEEYFVWDVIPKEANGI